MNEAFGSIRRGLTEAADFAQGKPTKAIVHDFTPLDIKAVRSEIGMTQEEFLAKIGRHSRPQPTVFNSLGSIIGTYRKPSADM